MFFFISVQLMLWIGFSFRTSNVKVPLPCSRKLWAALSRVIAGLEKPSFQP
jgi:hypothetical protein